MSIIVTAAETHHLLSTELCEYSDQPVSTQRGGSAATAYSGTYKGKTNLELQYVKLCVHIFNYESLMFSCIIAIFNPTVPSRGNGKPYSFNESTKDQFEGNLPQQKLHKGLQHQCYTLKSRVHIKIKTNRTVCI